MTIRSVTLLAAVIAAVLGITGCGGGDDAGAGEVTTSSLSKAQFIKKAEDACKDSRTTILSQLTAYSRKNPQANPEEGSARYTDMFEAVFLSTFEEELEAVRGLGAPEGEEEKIQAVLDAQAKAIEDVSAQGVESYLEAEGAFGQASRLLLEYGIGSCAVGDPAAARG